MVTQRQLRCLPKDSVDLIYWLLRVWFSRPGRVRKYFCSFPAGPSLKALLQLPGRANRKGAQRNVGAETRCAFECYVRASPSAKWAESSRVRMNSRIGTLVYTFLTFTTGPCVKGYPAAR